MFADEDTWQFGGGSVYAVGGDGSGGSLWSLQSMGAAIGSIGVGVRGIMSRQNSGDTDPAQDRFLDGEVAAVTPHSRRQTSYSSDLIYVPFTNYPIDEAVGLNEVEADKSTHLTHADPISLRINPPTVVLHTFMPLSPLTEQISRSSDPTSSASSQGMDVVQRVGTQGSYQMTPSTARNSIGRDPSWIIPSPLSIVPPSGHREGSGDTTTIESPIGITPTDPSFRDPIIATLAPLAQAFSTPQRPISSGSNVLD
jgi:hypothetical protein